MILWIAIVNTLIVIVMENKTREGLKLWEEINDEKLPTAVLVVTRIITWIVAIPMGVRHLTSVIKNRGKK